MSRTVILSLATAATITIASLASSAADARGFGGGGMGGGGGRSFSGGSHFSGGNHFAGRSAGRNRLASLNTGRGGRTGHPGHGHGHSHWHHHHHWIFRDGIWVDIDGGVDDGFDVAPVVATPGPCTCLTKTYTPDGLVVFADVCTNEAASARVDGTDAAMTPVPPAEPNVEPKASDVTPLPSADSKAAQASQAPTSANYAGRTYKDFLAATQAAAQKN
jgi:hypothetical protein